MPALAAMLPGDLRQAFAGLNWLFMTLSSCLMVAAAAKSGIDSQRAVGAGVLIATGGLLYTIGAVVYAKQRPDPSPTIFGYHEIFHVLVVAAAVAHFTAIAIYAAPTG